MVRITLFQAMLIVIRLPEKIVDIQDLPGEGHGVLKIRLTDQTRKGVVARPIGIALM